MNKFLPTSMLSEAEVLSVNRKGFTLVELLVVITIIGVLAVAGIATFTGVQKNARDARRKADIEAISKTLEAHYNDAACGATAANPYCPVTSVTAAVLFSDGTIPSNPSPAAPGGATYTGLPAAAVTTYNICATLESGGTFCRKNQQ